MKLRIIVMFTTVISLMILFSSCESLQNRSSIWVEINRYSEVPPKKGETQKMRFYISRNKIEIQKYYMDSIKVFNLNESDFLDEIKTYLEKETGYNNVNTYFIENGALVSRGYVNINTFEKYLDKHFQELEVKNKEYRRLYSEKYKDPQLGYLEYFANSLDQNFNNDKGNWKIIDQIDSRLFSDTISSRIFTLAQNPEGKYVVFEKNKSSVEFNFSP